MGDAIDYIQPSNYIVKSTDYDDSYETPVLTPGKSFILGYTNETDGIYDASQENVIIFDDFTTATKYVDFKFKVKSSAMKILISKNKKEYNIKYFYYLLNTIIILVDSHKRFWISEYQPLEITIPPYWYQKLVVDYLDVLFYKLELINKENKKLEEYVELSKKKILDTIFGDNSSYKSYYKNRTKTTLSELIPNDKIGDGDWILSENMDENGEYSLIQLKHIGKGEYINKSCNHINGNFFMLNNCKEIKSNYLLINRLVANDMNVCLLPSLGFKCITSVDVCWIAPSDSYNQKYLMYYLLSPDFQNKVKMKCSGSTRKRISKNNLVKIELYIHDYENQQRIVCEIERMFHELDSIIS